jgi:hypothetical protein
VERLVLYVGGVVLHEQGQREPHYLQATQSTDFETINGMPLRDRQRINPEVQYYADGKDCRLFLLTRDI